MHYMLHLNCYRAAAFERRPRFCLQTNAICTGFALVVHSALGLHWVVHSALSLRMLLL